MARFKRGIHFRIIVVMLVCVVTLGLFPQNTSAVAQTDRSFGSVAEQTPDKEIPGEYIVQYKHAAVKTKAKKEISFSETEKKLKEWDVEIESAGQKSDVVLLSAEEDMSKKAERDFLDKAEKDENILSIEKNYEVGAFGKKTNVTPFSTEVSDQQWGTDAIRAKQAWDLLPEETETVRVAVIDTGIDETHPDLEGRVISGSTQIEYNSSGSKYSDDGKDDHGHGTHVAGIIGAVWNNNKGIDGVMGKVDMELMPVKVLDNSGRGSTYDVINGIYYAADHGASIMNLSLGSASKSELEAEAVRYAQNKGCLVIAAAGNEAVNVATTYPASYDNVISVGSVDSAGKRSYFSNYGQDLDLSAPGSGIISTIPKKIALIEKASGESIYGDEEEGYYASWSGTSMATPHVAGVAALYKAANAGVSGFDIGNHLINTAQDVGEPGKDPETGAGIVDAAAVMGADIIKTPLIIKAPTAGKELFETVTLSAQVNPTMDIKTLKFFLDEQTEGNQIASIACDDQNSFYDHQWDTNTAADGTHKILAAVYDKNGTQVGETCKVSVSILNTITDGFTLRIKAPDGTGADTASYIIYGKKSDGSYKKLKSGVTSDLGFARVKGLDQDSEGYLLAVRGEFKEETTQYYIYNKKLTAGQLGSKLDVTGSNTKKVKLKAQGEGGQQLDSPYIKINIGYEASGETKYLEDINPWQMKEESGLYLEKGIYESELYKTTFALNVGTTPMAAYLLKEQWKIDDMTQNVEFDYEKATEVIPQFGSNVTGTIKIEGITGQSKIPFLSNYISGAKLFVSPGQSYKVSAEMKSAQSNSEAPVIMEKPDPIKITGKQMKIPFETDLKITKFEAKSGLKKDGDKQYMYVGATLSTNNIFGDTNGNILSYVGQSYPTFSIYKVNGLKRELVYEKTDRYQSSGSYWDSKRNYIGEKPPTSGNYIAELSYDAGVFGGVSKEEIPFELRTKSGSEEMSSAITMDEHVMCNAQMDLYYWDEKDGGNWKKGNSASLNAAGEDGIIRDIVKDTIKVNPEGINAAVLTLSRKKQGYSPSEPYKGISVVPFESLEDLEKIQLDSSDHVKISAKVSDIYENAKSASLYLPVSSNGNGKLTEAKPVTDVKINVGTTAYEQTLYIPKGNYDYAYSAFNDATANYMLVNPAFTADNNSKLHLNATTANKLTVETPAGYKGGKVIPAFASLNGSGASLSLAVGDTIYMSPGKYAMTGSLRTTDNKYEIGFKTQTDLDLSQDTVWKIGGDYTPNVKLKQRTVASGQSLVGELNFHDGKGNRLRSVREKVDGNYEAIYPEATVGAELSGERSLTLNSSSAYDEFVIPSEYYYGDGNHYVKFRYDTGSGQRETEKYKFTVGDNLEPTLTLDDSTNYKAKEQEDGSLILTINDDVRGFVPISIKIGPALVERDITFTQERDGRKIDSMTLQDIFTKNNNKVTMKFNLKPGDVVKVKAY